jgi:hypothetical protein
MEADHGCRAFSLSSAGQKLMHRRQWRQLGFYGHLLAFGPLAFFSLGGQALLGGQTEAKHSTKDAKAYRAQVASVDGQVNALGTADSVEGVAKELKREVKSR